MRRLFLVLDLSLLRQQADDERNLVLQQLTTTVARLWAAYQSAGQGGGSEPSAVGRPISWGYVLYDSACPDLLLKPQLRRIAQRLRKFDAVLGVHVACAWVFTSCRQLPGSGLPARKPKPMPLPISPPGAGLPAAFQETVQTDCRGAELAHFVALVDAATQPGSATGTAAAKDAAADCEAPAAALARALQAALSTSYLRKLQELADDSSISGASGALVGGAGAGRHTPDGLLAMFSPGLSSAAQLQAFLGRASAAGEEDEAADLGQLLDAALPAALWRCFSGTSLRLAWVAADTGSQREPLAAAVLPRLQVLLQQLCPCAVAASLAELAGPCSPPKFAARLGLPCPAAGEQQAEGEDEGCWPLAAAPDGNALDSLKLLLAQLEGAKGAGSASSPAPHVHGSA